MTKLIVTSRNFEKALKNCKKRYIPFQCLLYFTVALSSPNSHAHRFATSDCRKLKEEVLDDF
jgi:hypothetical protein